MKQIEVQIMQQSYVLGCPEGEEARLREAVERVDHAMVGIRDAGRVRSRDRIAVLAALHMAFELADQASWAQAQAQAVQELAAAGADKDRDAGAAAQTFPFSEADVQRLQGLADRLGQALEEWPSPPQPLTPHPPQAPASSDMPQD